MNLAKVLDLPIDIYEIIFAFEGRFFPLKNGKWISKLNLEKYIFLNRKLKTMIQQPSIQWTDNVKKWTFICIDCMHTNKTRHLILKKHITMIDTSVLITYIWNKYMLHIDEYGYPHWININALFQDNMYHEISI